MVDPNENDESDESDKSYKKFLKFVHILIDLILKISSNINTERPTFFYNLFYGEIFLKNWVERAKKKYIEFFFKVGLFLLNMINSCSVYPVYLIKHMILKLNTLVVPVKQYQHQFN